MKDNFNTIINVFKELNYILEKKHKTTIIFIFFLIIIGAGFELVGVSAIFPFIQAILSPEQLLQNKYVNLVVEIVGIREEKDLILIVGGGMIALYLVKNIFLLFSNYVQCSYNTGIRKELSVKMLNSYMSRPYLYFLDVNSSEILRCCTNDVASVYLMIGYLMVIIAEVLNMLLIGLFILYTDIGIALGILAFMTVTLVGIVALLKPAMKKAGKKNIEASTKASKIIYQAVNGMKEIFVMQRKEMFSKEYEEESENLRIVQRTYDFLNACPDRVVEGICISGIIGVICVRVISGSDMTDFIPKMGVFAMATFKLFPSIGKISNRISSMIYYRPQLANCYQSMKEVDEYSAEMREYIERKKSKQALRDLKFKQEVVLDKIFWKYKNQRDFILKDTELKITKGESIGLIGESGAGKTTLSDIILGLLKPQKGDVLMDGIDIFTIPKEWAHIVGYVPQAVFLMDDTVRNNVRFGAELDDENQIWEALERAQLASFIRMLPDGLDTIVGERGIKFSGGQRQRIVIARALYNRPEILVLDEATAALDNETETAVMESIEALQGQITLIIVAHRLSTIRNCDKIYEVKDGVAVERKKEEVMK